MWGLFRFLLARLCTNKYYTNIWRNRKGEGGMIRRVGFSFSFGFSGDYLISFGVFCFLYPSSITIRYFHRFPWIQTPFP